METMGKSLFINVNKSLVVLILTLIAGSLLICSILGQLLLQSTPPRHIQGIINFFNLAAEGNLPTYYSSFLLLFSALLLFVIIIKEKSDKSPDVPYWVILTIGFLYLSLDEMLTLHESFSLFVREVTNYSGQGVFRSPWVIAGTIIVVLLLLVFIRFLIHLKPKTRFVFLLAGFLYFGGTIGFEIIENVYADAYGQDLMYSMLQNLEEGMEMAGIIVFISALLGYIGGNYGSLHFDFHTENKS